MDIKRIPFSEAKKFAQKFGQDRVVIISYDKANDTHHVITWGNKIADCEFAARQGNLIKKHLLHWPENECHATPSRLKKKGITL